MLMILCKKCGENMMGDKLNNNFRDKCQICGKIKSCSKWNIVVDGPKSSENKKD